MTPPPIPQNLPRTPQGFVDQMMEALQSLETERREIIEEIRVTVKTFNLPDPLGVTLLPREPEHSTPPHPPTTSGQ